MPIYQQQAVRQDELPVAAKPKILIDLTEETVTERARNAYEDRLSLGLDEIDLNKLSKRYIPYGWREPEVYAGNSPISTRPFAYGRSEQGQISRTVSPEPQPVISTTNTESKGSGQKQGYKDGVRKRKYSACDADTDTETDTDTGSDTSSDTHRFSSKSSSHVKNGGHHSPSRVTAFTPFGLVDKTKTKPRETSIASPVKRQRKMTSGNSATPHRLGLSEQSLNLIEILEGSDSEEEENTYPTNAAVFDIMNNFQHDTSTISQSQPLSHQPEVVDLEDSIEGEEIEDDVVYSVLPESLQDDNDVEFIKAVKRQPCRVPSNYKKLTEYRYKRSNCAPGKCVELANGSFVRIEMVLESSEGKKWINGQVFWRHNGFDCHKWPRRHNEVVMTTEVTKGQPQGTVKIPVEQVLRNRVLIVTNATFPHISPKDHPDSLENVFSDKDMGPLFCRWKQTRYKNTKGKIIEESIERISFDEADKIFKVDEAVLRDTWRKVHTVPGGSSSRADLGYERNGLHQRDVQRYTFGDAFCGGGGASCGADEAGLSVKFGVDLNQHALQTYSLNHAEKGTECRLEGIDSFIHYARGRKTHIVDILHMSPPCQPYSAAHTIPNIENDEKNEAALFAVGELLRVCRPRVVTIEETFGLFSRHIDWFNALIKMFLDVSYSVRWTVAHMEEYGLPQKRRRLLINAAGPGEVLPPFPLPTHGTTDTARPLSTIHDAISVIPVDSPNHNIEAAKFNPDRYQQPYSMHTQAATITCSGGQKNWHPSGTRAYTVRELACLQRFPMSYKFANQGITHLRRQIGNAVPPYIFKKVFREIIKSLNATDAKMKRG